MNEVKLKYITVLLLFMILTFRLVNAQNIKVSSFIKEQDKEELRSLQRQRELLDESQKKQEQNNDIEEVFIIVKGEKRFQGRDAEERFPEYIEYAINYPKEALRKGIEGTIIVKFTVNRKGEVEETHILRGISSMLNNEVIRVINSSPRWTPGSARGRPFNSVYTLSIDFRLKDLNNSFFIDGSSEIEFKNFIEQNVEYPQEALENRTEGVVLVGFTVTKGGDLKDTYILRGSDYFLNKEAVRVVNSFPKWNISTHRKMSKEETYVFPIKFKILEGVEY